MKYILVTDLLMDARNWHRFGCSKMVDCGIAPIIISPSGNSLEWIEEQISSLTPRDIVLIESTLSDKLKAILALLGKYSIPYFTSSQGLMAIYYMQSIRSALSVSEYIRLKYEDAGGAILRWKKYAIDKWQTRDLPASRLWLTAGSQAAPSKYGVLPMVSKRLPVYGFDYVTARNAPIKPETNTIVFLDGNMESCPDGPEGMPCTAEKYWPAMELFFKAVERKFGSKVIIAQHPRRISPIPLLERVSVEDTASLVQRSRMVINHASTSASFAVYFKKPLMFVTTNEMEQTHWRGHIARMSSHFRYRRINADRFIDEQIAIPEVNMGRYVAYKHGYMCEPTARTDMWEALLGAKQK